MGVNFTVRMCVGFVFDDTVINKLFKKHTSTPGTFHLEDRFDPKTGKKVEPVKVWDTQPKSSSWYEIGSHKIHGDDPEEICKVFKDLLGCDVSMVGSYCEGDFQYTFTLNKRDKEPFLDEGRFTVYGSPIPVNDIINMVPELIELKNRLLNFGLTAGEPEVFLSYVVG